MHNTDTVLMVPLMWEQIVRMMAESDIDTWDDERNRYHFKHVPSNGMIGENRIIFETKEDMMLFLLKFS